MKTHATKPTLVLATGNAKKGKELQELTADSFEVLISKQVAFFTGADVVEDAPDFAGNAWKKAQALVNELSPDALGHRNVAAPGIDWIVADDSGLIVDALGGLPGVRSARFAGDHDHAPVGPSGALLSTDDANNDLLLHKLAGVDDDQRTARFFSCVVAHHVPSGRRHEASGTVSGRIARALLGSGGFGYDPLFVVDDEQAPDGVRGRRMAELSSAEKHAISHRGRAMRALLKLMLNP